MVQGQLSKRDGPIVALWVLLFSLLFSFPSDFLAQTSPQDLNFSRITEILLDLGEIWGYHSLSHPSILDSCSLIFFVQSPYKYFRPGIQLWKAMGNIESTDHKNNIYLITLFGGEAKMEWGDSARYRNIAWVPYLWWTLGGKRHWYSQLYVRFTNQARALDHYSGLPRDIRRAGFNTGEVDRWVFGWRNDWARFELGRGREIRGPMTEDNIALSGYSPPYERLVLGLCYKRLSYTYVYGFLESLNRGNGLYPDTLRYLIVRTLEYTNRHNFIVGISEITVMSGPARGIDLAYLNPFALQLEVEQNRRENVSRGNWANGMWEVDCDYLPIPSLRLAGSFFIDEIQLDKTDRKTSADQLGYLLHIAYTPVRSPVILTILADYIQLGTWTTQHNRGPNNLVSRGQYMGHPIGNDADRLTFSLRTILRAPLLWEGGVGVMRRGANSLLNEPYQPYNTTPHLSFPSPPVLSERFLQMRLEGYPTHYLYIGLKGKVSRIKPPMEKASIHTRWELTCRYMGLGSKVF